MSKKHIIIGVVIVVLAISAFALFNRGERTGDSSSGFAMLDNFEGEITVHLSQSCGCCSLYVDYLKRKGVDITIDQVPEVDSIKDKLGVPSNMRSCHTTEIGGYFVEGHIPLEAVNKLMEEKPDVAGITMPGMPSGSPGMPGSKMGDFVVYSVNHDGSTQEFMRI